MAKIKEEARKFRPHRLNEKRHRESASIGKEEKKKKTNIRRRKEGRGDIDEKSIIDKKEKR